MACDNRTGTQHIVKDLVPRPTLAEAKNYIRGVGIAQGIIGGATALLLGPFVYFLNQGFAAAYPGNGDPGHFDATLFALTGLIIVIWIATYYGVYKFTAAVDPHLQQAKAIIAAAEASDKAAVLAAQTANRVMASVGPTAHNGDRSDG